jgi:hypothetical protein
MINFEAQNIGEFREVTHGKFFSYRATSNPWALSHGLLHEIDVVDGVRFGNVKKTVCNLALNENDFGFPILEKWVIKNHFLYKA